MHCLVINPLQFWVTSVITAHFQPMGIYMYWSYFQFSRIFMLQATHKSTCSHQKIRNFSYTHSLTPCNDHPSRNGGPLADKLFANRKRGRYYMALSLLAHRKPLIINMAGSFLCINELRALYFGKWRLETKSPIMVVTSKWAPEVGGLPALLLRSNWSPRQYTLE